MEEPIVFIDQLAGADPTRVEREYGKINDTEAAKRFGVRIYEEFSYWSWRACAIANVSMVLATEEKLKETLYELVCEALLMNGYAYKNRHGVLDVGWKHSVLCKLLEFRGLKARVLRHLGLREARKLLEEGKYLILSVKSKSGGHMVLVKSIDEGKVTYNDPWGYGGENVEESLITFGDRFLGKGLAAWQF